MKIHTRIRIYNTRSDLFVYDKRKRKTTIIEMWIIARTNYRPCNEENEEV